MIEVVLPGDRIDDVADAAAGADDDTNVVRLAKPQIKHGVIAACAPARFEQQPHGAKLARELRISSTAVIERRRRKRGGGHG